jgi:WD40 repeat protein
MPHPSRQTTAIYTLIGHSGVVWSVAISPDGNTLVSGDADGIIKVWGKPYVI